MKEARTKRIQSVKIDQLVWLAKYIA